MHPTGTITHGELDLFGGRAPQRTISTRCTPMVCTASFQLCFVFKLECFFQHFRGFRVWIVNARLFPNCQLLYAQNSRSSNQINSLIFTILPSVVPGAGRVIILFYLPTMFISVRLKISTLRLQVLLSPVPCNKMIHRCGQDNDGRQWPNLFMVTYE